MRIERMLAVMFGAILVITVAQARDTHLKLPIKDAMATADYQAKVRPGHQDVFRCAGAPEAGAELGTIKTNKKTNFFNKSDKEGCEWAFLSAMLALQYAARERGGNAMINISSNYKNIEFTSETEYECGAGA